MVGSATWARNTECIALHWNGICSKSYKNWKIYRRNHYTLYTIRINRKVTTKTHIHIQTTSFLLSSSKKEEYSMKCVDSKGECHKLKSAFSSKWIFHLFIVDIFDWCSSNFVGFYCHITIDYLLLLPTGRLFGKRCCSTSYSAILSAVI